MADFISTIFPKLVFVIIIIAVIIGILKMFKLDKPLKKFFKSLTKK